MNQNEFYLEVSAQLITHIKAEEHHVLLQKTTLLLVLN